MGLAGWSCAMTGGPVTEMLVGGGPVGASAAAAGDPGGGADDVRTGVPDCTAIELGETTGAGAGEGGGGGAGALLVVGNGAGSDGVEVEPAITARNSAGSAPVIPLVSVAVTS